MVSIEDWTSYWLQRKVYVVGSLRQRKLLAFMETMAWYVIHAICTCNLLNVEQISGKEWKIASNKLEKIFKHFHVFQMEWTSGFQIQIESIHLAAYKHQMSEFS